MSLTYRTKPTKTSLTTVARVLDFTGLTVSDAYLSSASRLIEGYLGRPLAQASASETFSGSDRVRIYLGLSPVKEVEEIRLNGVAIPASDFSLEDAAAGTLYRRVGFPSERPSAVWVGRTPIDEWGKEIWAVDYVGGYVLPSQEGEGGDPSYAAPTATETLLPFDLELAAVDLAIYLYNGRGAATNVTSERLGDWAVSYDATRSAIPPEISKRIEHYRRVW